jgi:hypothetical protein
MLTPEEQRIFRKYDATSCRNLFTSLRSEPALRNPFFGMPDLIGEESEFYTHP